MQRIPIKFAAAGMTIAKVVNRGDGMVLAGEGLKLTDSIIDRLRNAGVGSLVVQGRPLPGLNDGFDLQKLLGRLDYLFRKYRRDPLMWTMRNLLEQHFKKAIEEQEQAQREARETQLAQD